MTSADPAAEGHRRADEFLTHLAGDDQAAADGLLDQLTDVRDLAFVGAALTRLARTEGHRLLPAQRAQANTRQMRLGALRDANRTDPEGLRLWLRRAAEEVLLIRSLQETTDRLLG